MGGDAWWNTARRFLIVMKKVRINIDDAVTALAGTGKSKERAINRKTLSRLREALRSGKWRILPRKRFQRAYEAEQHFGRLEGLEREVRANEWIVYFKSTHERLLELLEALPEEEARTERKPNRLCTKTSHP